MLQTGGVLNYSLTVPAPDRLNLKAGFQQGTDVVCAILATFGVVGKLEGTSDVAVGDRKISGNAQAWRWKSLLVHGTLLVDFDFDLAETVLLHPLREPEYRRKRNHREFLVSLSALSVHADRNELEKAAAEAAQQVFGRVNAIRDPASFNLPGQCSVGPSQCQRTPVLLTTTHHLWRPRARMCGLEGRN